MPTGLVVILCAICFFGGAITDAVLHKALTKEFLSILVDIKNHLSFLVDKVGGK